MMIDHNRQTDPPCACMHICLLALDHHDHAAVHAQFNLHSTSHDVMQKRNGLIDTCISMHVYIDIVAVSGQQASSLAKKARSLFVCLPTIIPSLRYFQGILWPCFLLFCEDRQPYNSPGVFACVCGKICHRDKR